MWHLLHSTNTTCDGSPYQISAADADDIVKNVCILFNRDV